MPSLSLIIHLPEAIIFTFQDYLNYLDYRNIFNTCKHPYLQELKKKSALYYLTPEYSLEYYKNETFRLRLLSLIDNPSRQLGVDLEVNVASDNLQMFSDKRRVKLKFLSRRCSMDNLSYFSSVQDLSINSADYFTSFDALRSIVKLEIIKASHLTDVSSLAHCKALTTVFFSCCLNLLDLRGVAHVKSLRVALCPIRNEGIACLASGNIEKLILTANSDITSINHIHSLKILKLMFCTKITSIAGLPYLTTLYVQKCGSFKSYDNLPSLRTLTIGFDCHKKLRINTSNCLQIKYLDMSNDFHGLRDPREFLKLSSLQYLALHGGSDSLDLNCLSALPFLKRLSLNHFENPTFFNVHLFQRLRVLELKSCNDFEDFEGITEPMPNLHDLHIENCTSFETLSGLLAGNNRKMNLSIQDCEDFIPDVTFYRVIMNCVEKFEYGCSSSSNRAPKLDDFDNKDDSNSIPIRDKTVVFYHSPPFVGLALQSLFRNTQVLVLNQYQEEKFRDLSLFVSTGIEKIPVLCIEDSSTLKRLYPRLRGKEPVIPEHEWVILQECNQLTDISSIANVPRISIDECEKLTDISSLIGKRCKHIDFSKGRDNEKWKNPIGYEELKHYIHRFENIDQSIFRIHPFDEDPDLGPIGI